MRGKRYFLGMVLISISSSLVFLGFKISSKKEAIRKSEITLTTLSSVAGEAPFTLAEYMKPTLLMYMNSECSHCRWQIEELAKKQQEFSSAQLILISHEPADSLDAFLSSSALTKSQLITANINPEKVKEIFGSTLTPQIFIYKDNQLIRSFKGETKLALIAELLQERKQPK